MDIFEAIQNNDINKVEKIIDSDKFFYIESYNSNGNTPLYVASVNNRIEIVKLLLAHPNIDINEENVHGNTALYQLCLKKKKEDDIENKYLEVIKLLLDHPDIDVNKKSQTPDYDSNASLIAVGSSPLHVVQDIEILKLLLAHTDIDINIRSNYGHTPLLKWCANRHDPYGENIDLIKLLLTRSDVDVNAQDNNGNTALHYLVQKKPKYIEVIKILLNKPDININLKNIWDDTVIKKAIIYHNLKAVELLLEMPNIEIKTKLVKDDLLITVCSDNGNYDKEKYIKLLLQHPDINVNGLAQKIPLFMVRSSESFKLLLQHPDIEVNKKNKNADTILNYILSRYTPSYPEKYDTEKIKMLLEHPKIDINAENSKNETTFLIAVEKGLHTYPNEIFNLIINNPKLNIRRNKGIVNFIKKSFGRNKNIHIIINNLKKKDIESINKILDNIGD